MEEIFEKLTRYTLALKVGLETTAQASERSLISMRMATAAEMFAALHSSGKIESIQELVQSEVRAHGWSFISGQAGETIAKEWVAFAHAVTGQQ